MHAEIFMAFTTLLMASHGGNRSHQQTNNVVVYKGQLHVWIFQNTMVAILPISCSEQSNIAKPWLWRMQTKFPWQFSILMMTPFNGTNGIAPKWDDQPRQNFLAVSCLGSAQTAWQTSWQLFSNYISIVPWTTTNENSNGLVTCCPS